jgi:hypothetical protein
MSICFLDIFLGIKVSSEISIGASLSIYHDNVFAIKDTDSNFKLLWWFLSDVPFCRFLFWRYVTWVDFKPTFNHTLTHTARWVVKLSVFNWFNF